MIRIIHNSILEATEDIIGHQTNCMGVFNSGLAEQIRRKYPAVYREYKRLCNEKAPAELLSTVQILPIDQNKYVANMFGQLNYGRHPITYTEYDALYTALNELKEHAKKQNKTIALPYEIGCGLANGNWDKVYRIIEDVFKDYEVTLYKFFRLIVAGSRSFEDYTFMEQKLLQLLKNKHLPSVEIISGTCNGADKLGEKFAQKHNCQLKRFPANWYPNGKGKKLPNGTYQGLDRAAGPKRNKKMAEYADACVVFMSGESSGSLHMYQTAKERGLFVRLIKVP